MTDQNSNRSTADWLVELCVYAPIGFVLDAHKYVPEFVDRGRNQVALARFLGKFALDRIEQRLGPLGSVLRTPSPPPPPSPPSTPATAERPPAPAAERVGAVPAPAEVVSDGIDTGRAARSAGGATTARRRKAAAPPASLSSPGAPPANSAPAAAGRPRNPHRSSGSPPASSTSAATRSRRSSRPSAGPPAAPNRPARTGGSGAPTAAKGGELPIEGYATLAASQIVPRLTTLSATDLAAVAGYERANRGRRTILNRVEQLLAER